MTILGGVAAALPAAAALASLAPKERRWRNQFYEAPEPEPSGLWVHVDEALDAQEYSVVVCGMVGGEYIDRRFYVTQMEVVETGKCAVDIVLERIHATQKIQHIEVVRA